MYTTLAKYWNVLRSSFWFAPSLMTLMAILACVATTVADEALGAAWIHELGWFTPIAPQGARDLLATVAGSMITVAGVTFSITIAAVSYASANLGPRLLPDFMRDVRNQISLGAFIATFVYCILVLRTVRGAGESGDGTEVFVPYIGVMVALALTLANIGVLIFYIHHVPRSISAFEVVARLGGELYRRVDAEPFPAQIGEDPPEGARPPDAGTVFPPSAGVPIRARTQGYLTHLNAVELMRTAQRHDAVVLFDQRPGDFVTPGVILARAYGACADDPDFHDDVRAALIVERERTPYQDILFIVQQLAQIAARALSPGVNDPYTANGCVNWLGSALIAFGNRPLPSPYRYDESGTLRAIVPEFSFADMASAVFDQLRPYAGKDRTAALHMLAVIRGILENVDHPGYRAVMLGHAAALKTEVDASIAHPDDRALFARTYAALNRGE